MQEIEQTRAMARLTAAYIVGILCEILHSDSLDILDVLITMAIGSANSTHLNRSASVREGIESESNMPKRGVSRNAISRAINVPLETVRRRVAGLLSRNVLEERSDGLVLSPSTAFGLSGNTRVAGMNAQLLRQLFRNLKAQGVKLD